MKKLFLAITIAFAFSANAQSVAINTDGSNAHTSAILDLKSSNRGVLVPRMTAAERSNIGTPATGLMVYQTDATTGFYFYNGAAWTNLTGLQGIPGVQGDPGPQGSQGPVGLTGPQGNPGPQGIQGLPGAAGLDGAQGIQGVPGSQGPIGPAGLTWQGAWASGTAYVVNNAVGYNGASYFCITATSGTTTPDLDTTNWALLASVGATGPQGNAGQGIPTGGTAGQILSKTDATDYNTVWINQASAGIIETENGVTFDNNKVILGGAINKPTTISAITAVNKIAFAGEGADMVSIDGQTLSVDGTNNRVGVGTNTPTATLQVSGQSADIATPDGIIAPKLTRTQLNAKTAYSTNQAGAMVYITDITGSTITATANITEVGYYFFDGLKWKSLMASSSYVVGEIKTMLLTNDSNGWIRLNGRLRSSLTTTQQARASALGIGTNIPDATGAYLGVIGGSLGNVTSANSVTIAQNQLPNVTPTITVAAISAGTPSGTVSVADRAAFNTNGDLASHSHSIPALSGTASSAGNHNHTVEHNTATSNLSPNGGERYLQNGGGTLNNQSTVSRTTSTSGDHSHSVTTIANNTASANANHSHLIPAHGHTASFAGAALGTHVHTATSSSINGNQTQVAVDIRPRTLSVNMFIYLGE